MKLVFFNGKYAPEPGTLAGYAALISLLNLRMPPPTRLSLIGEKHRNYAEGEWSVFSRRYRPDDTLLGHLTFALKYEGVDLLFFKKFFQAAGEKEIVSLITSENTKYTRKIWFMFEFLMDRLLYIPDLTTGNYVPLLDPEKYYTAPEGEYSRRHRILNNLPGQRGFCPLVRRTEKIDAYISAGLPSKIRNDLSRISPDILQRTSSFLLLKDSHASFTIEGEEPTQNRAQRWGRALAEAGRYPLTEEELLRLQQIIIESSRFLTLGYRKEGGFVGMYDRRTGDPVPYYISARSEDLDDLMNELLAASRKMSEDGFHPVLTAALIGFGFVFIHPFVDGNGRVHRYILHHILAQTKFTPDEMIFPLSAAILNNLSEYRRVLESYSIPLLECIDWEKTPDHNVRVLNDTADYYRYFDATAVTEFLFDCIDYTINKIIPEEVAYLSRYDRMKEMLESRFSMPDKTVALLIRFLEQNNGLLSQRALKKEFAQLTDSEITEIENYYQSL